MISNWAAAHDVHPNTVHEMWRLGFLVRRPGTRILSPRPGMTSDEAWRAYTSYLRVTREHDEDDLR